MTEESRKDDLKHMKEWLITQRHLPKIPDKKLVLFLHSCDYQLEFTKRTIEAHYTIKASNPEFFSNRDPFGSDIQEILTCIDVALLPKSTPEGYSVVMGRLKHTNATNFSWNSAVKLLYMVSDVCQAFEELIPGFIFVYDAQNFTLSHLTKLSLMTVKKYLDYMQDGIPIRVRGVHSINVNSVGIQLYNLLKPFLQKQYLDTTFLHTGMPEEFYSAVPQHCLPSDYNGSLGTISELSENTIKMIQSHSNWYKEDENIKIDESKRDKTRGNTNNNVFGVEGSFKKLAID